MTIILINTYTFDYTNLNNMKNEFKNHLAEKEVKDYNDLKHICILLGFIGALMVLWFGYVIICL